MCILVHFSIFCNEIMLCNNSVINKLVKNDNLYFDIFKRIWKMHNLQFYAFMCIYFKRVLNDLIVLYYFS